MIYSFEDCELDLRAFELRRGGRAEAIEPQVFDVLHYLVEHRDRAVTKEELLDEVWGGRFVSESALTSRIKQARRAIGDDGVGQRLIRTVHGRGYRFVGDVSSLADDEPPEPASSIAGSRAPVCYTRVGDLNIAYQITGAGSWDIALVAGFVSHLELDWAEPRHAAFLDRLGTLGRLIRFDKRGTGLSDRPSGLPHLETRMDDLRAVLDAAGSERAVLFGYSEGGPMAALFAATYPERTAGLVIYGSWARRLLADDYPWGQTPEERARYAEQIERDWGWENDMRAMCPSADEAMARWWGERCRAAASPGAAKALIEMNSLVDIREVLPSVHVPAFVLHRTGDRDTRVEEGRYVAERLPDARFVELPGVDHFVAIDPDQILDPVEEFLHLLGEATVSDTTLVTLLVVQVGESDQGERFLADAPAIVRAQRGRRVYNDAAPLLAAFDGPVRAVRCGFELVKRAQLAGATAMACVYLTEIPRLGIAVWGPDVTTAAGLAAQARPGIVLVSQMVRDLVHGSNLRFEPHTTVTLGSTPHAVEMFAAHAPF